MKLKGLTTYLFSAVGVAAMFVILVAINWIVARGKVRVDLTEYKEYTLSDGTKNILSKLDSPVQIRFYNSKSQSRMPVQLKTFAQRVDDMLEEFRQVSKGNIQIERLDPEPDSAAEESAKSDGIDAIQLGGGEMMYLGLFVTMDPAKETVSVLLQSERNPEEGLKKSEEMLEYNIARAISRVANPTKPTIGLMSSLSLAGGMGPQGMRGGQSLPEWTFHKELQRSFNVTKLELSADSIPNDIKVLLVIHPKGISPTTEYALDQFVLRGGKLILCLDPMSLFDPAGAGGPMGMGGGPTSSTTDKLLKAWGLTFDVSKAVADTNFVTPTRGGRNPAILSINEKGVNSKDPLMGTASSFLMVFAGAFTGTPAEGLTRTVLINSTRDSNLVDAASLQSSLQNSEPLMRSFTPSGNEYALAVRLTGKFKTAFPDGKPKAEVPKPGEEKPPENKPPTPDAPGLKASTMDGDVILVGDVDFLNDQAGVEMMVNPFNRTQVATYPNYNLPFAQAAIEQMSGDSNLIKVRSRTSRSRPFTVINKIRTDAEAKSQGKIQELENTIQDSQKKISELQRTKAGDSSQRAILSAELKQEIETIRSKDKSTRAALREERRNMARDVNAMETKLTWLNIAAAPVVLIFAGVLLAILRRRKQAAV